ncbi:amino acid ABC transporter ATP-binding protein [Saccharopolyspora shandongensis]|uniref:amino acid ABC transporter ATP-binding protein n=1 Tax=Saccharopolyspora shandongensis TaxID=418495 RepID=UPI0033F5FB4F
MARCPVEVAKLHKSFGDLEVLKGVDLAVAKGEVVVLMGPSGSGKTTLLRCMNLLEEPDAGQVDICGCRFDCGGRQSRKRGREVQRARRRTAMVFQHFNLFPHMSALANVIEGARYTRKLSKSEAVELGERLLDRVGLAGKRDEFPSRLSGGQKQRVAIARALAMEPEVVLLDEPTSALDPELRAEVLQVIRGLADDGLTMVIVTHETKFARDLADRVVLMEHGVIVEQAEPAVFFNRPSSPRTRSFLRLVEDDPLPNPRAASRDAEEHV